MKLYKWLGEILITAGVVGLVFSGVTGSEIITKNSVYKKPLNSKVFVGKQNYNAIEDDKVALAGDMDIKPLVTNVSILGQVYPSDTKELYFNDMFIEDKVEFVNALSKFTNLEKCEMCNCNYTNEEMEQLCNVFSDTKFVWIVHCAQWSLRTDAVSFSTMFVDYGWGPETSKDFEPLKYCTDLEALDIGHKSCTDISFLKDLKKLKILILAINRITDISPLENLTNLTYLELFLNNIEDLSPLEKLENLEYLNLCHNRNLGEIEPILHYTNLKKLWISNCNLTGDEKARIQAAYPNAWLEFNVYESVQAGWREGKVYNPMRNAFNNGVIDPMFYPKVKLEEINLDE